jgi:hypothetical protein
MKMLEDIKETIKESKNFILPHRYLNSGLPFLLWKWLYFANKCEWITHWSFEIALSWTFLFYLLINIGIYLPGLKNPFFSSIYLVVLALYMLYGLVLIGMIGIAHRNKQK